MSAKSKVEPGQRAMSQLLTPEETAEALRLSAGTLAVWRSTKRYPLPFVKVGSKIFYRASAVEAFITSREVK